MSISPLTSGGRDLAVLLQKMEPVLHEATYVFVTVEEPLKDVLGYMPLALFREAEGLTLIMKEADALVHDLAYTYPSRWITLNVHSSLEAVGFLAIITRRLAAEGISVNPVSAFFHDHLFVPASKAGAAMHILRDLSKEARGRV